MGSSYDLQQLKAFIAVAEVGGFRRAAEHLDLEQSLLSRRVNKLENEIGVSLFERHRGGVRLTNAGDRLLNDLRRVFLDLDRAISSASAAGHASEGRLAVGVAVSVSAGYLRQLLLTWIQQYPDVVFEIREAGSRELLAAVMNRRLDVTFLTGSTWPPGCDTECLWMDIPFAAVGRDSTFGGRASLTIQDLAKQRFIVSQGGCGPEIRNWLIKRLSDFGVSPRVDSFDVSREVLLNLVGLGFGISLAASLETGVDYPNVRFVPVTGEQIPFNVVWSPENDNPALRRFLSLARALAKQHVCAAPLRTRDLWP